MRVAKGRFNISIRQVATGADQGGHPGCNSEECIKSIVEKDHREI